jgi:hypothetical protein
MRHNEGRQCTAHTELRARTNGVLWAASARPAGQAARGFIVELLAWATRHEEVMRWLTIAVR